MEKDGDESSKRNRLYETFGQVKRVASSFRHAMRLYPRSRPLEGYPMVEIVHSLGTYDDG